MGHGGNTQGGGWDTEGTHKGVSGWDTEGTHKGVLGLDLLVIGRQLLERAVGLEEHVAAAVVVDVQPELCTHKDPRSPIRRLRISYPLEPKSREKENIVDGSGSVQVGLQVWWHGKAKRAWLLKPKPNRNFKHQTEN